MARPSRAVAAAATAANSAAADSAAPASPSAPAAVAVAVIVPPPPARRGRPAHLWCRRCVAFAGTCPDGSLRCVVPAGRTKCGRCSASRHPKMKGIISYLCSVVSGWKAKANIPHEYQHLWQSGLSNRNGEWDTTPCCTELLFGLWIQTIRKIQNQHTDY
ncbi:hypothetical protein ABZX51_010596 [Aspergillus tubingensis]